LGTPATIDLDSIAEARRLLWTQTSSDGQVMNLTPKFLIVGPEIKVPALQLTASLVVPTTLQTAIPVALKSMEVVVEARIQDRRPRHLPRRDARRAAGAGRAADDWLRRGHVVHGSGPTSRSTFVQPQVLALTDRGAVVYAGTRRSHQQEGAEMRRPRRAWPWAEFCLAGVLAAPIAAWAAPQSSDQQGRINDMNKYGVRVAKSQNRADVDCVKNAGRGLAVRSASRRRRPPKRA
jgi:hypothetical protein